MNKKLTVSDLLKRTDTEDITVLSIKNASANPEIILYGVKEQWEVWPDYANRDPYRFLAYANGDGWDLATPDTFEKDLQESLLKSSKSFAELCANFQGYMCGDIYFWYEREEDRQSGNCNIDILDFAITKSSMERLPLYILEYSSNKSIAENIRDFSDGVYIIIDAKAPAGITYNVGFINDGGENDETQLCVESNEDPDVVMADMCNFILSLKEEMEIKEITYIERVEVDE